jgi:hypothetical protein
MLSICVKLDGGRMHMTRRAVGLTSESSIICSQEKPGENRLPIPIKRGNRQGSKARARKQKPGLPGTVAVAHNSWTMSRRLFRVLAFGKTLKCGRVQLGVEFLV